MEEAGEEVYAIQVTEQLRGLHVVRSTPDLSRAVLGMMLSGTTALYEKLRFLSGLIDSYICYWFLKGLLTSKSLP